LDTNSESQRSGVRLTVITVIGVLYLFLIVLASGSPIKALGGMGPSMLYSVAVFMPVFLLCVLALKRMSGRGPRANTDSG
jgi:hypothetical protein